MVMKRAPERAKFCVQLQKIVYNYKNCIQLHVGENIRLHAGENKCEVGGIMQAQLQKLHCPDHQGFHLILIDNY